MGDAATAATTVPEAPVTALKDALWFWDARHARPLLPDRSPARTDADQGARAGAPPALRPHAMLVPRGVPGAPGLFTCGEGCARRAPADDTKRRSSRSAPRYTLTTNGLVPLGGARRGRSCSDPDLTLANGGPPRRATGSTFGIQVLIYGMPGRGLNVVVGLAGLLDLGYVAFCAIGASAIIAAYDDPGNGTGAGAVGVPGSGFLAGRGFSPPLGGVCRLPGAAPARRLSRHRHARVRRNHPARADQLGR